MSGLTIHGPGPVIPQRIRKDINTLTKDELDLLITAWDYIQHQDPDKEDNPNTKSFFTLAGFHGEPFRGAGYSNPSWWGGYCNHGNVLFPTWHRAYLLSLENALRQAPGCENITLPYWNEIFFGLDFPIIPTGPDIPRIPDFPTPIPQIFLQKKYTYKNGHTIDNPLYSYAFQKSVHDRLSPIPDADYSKPKGYQTVRYPFSGLVGDSDADATGAHNNLMNMLGEPKTTELLQSNVTNWLVGEVENNQGKIVGGGTRENYLKSLFAPDYTVYSNTTSAQRYNDDNFDDSGSSGGKASLAAVPIEKPHNAIHLAVGGFEVPGIANYSFVPGANGDMGENDTASFDPIFFFHHCFIDLMFWAWQLKNKHENELSIRDKYPGTNSVDNQGPTPGTPGGTWLNLNTPLNPFTNRSGTPVTSNDMTNIHKLGYGYDGLAEALSQLPPPVQTSATAHVRIGGVSRADAKGSFFLSAWASEPDGGKRLVALEPVLSRWHVAGCANCSTHLNVTAITSIPMTLSEAQEANFEVLVHTRGRKYGHSTLGGKTPNLRLGKLLLTH